MLSSRIILFLFLFSFLIYLSLLYIYKFNFFISSIFKCEHKGKMPKFTELKPIKQIEPIFNQPKLAANKVDNYAKYENEFKNVPQKKKSCCFCC
jgi:hypothetical protein